MVDIPLSLRRMASATPDIQLPSQLMAGTNLYCLVNIGTLCVNNLPQSLREAEYFIVFYGCKSDAPSSQPLRHHATLASSLYGNLLLYKL